MWLIALDCATNTYLNDTYTLTPSCTHSCPKPKIHTGHPHTLTLPVCKLMTFNTSFGVNHYPMCDTGGYKDPGIHWSDHNEHLPACSGTPTDYSLKKPKTILWEWIWDLVVYRFFLFFCWIINCWFDCWFFSSNLFDSVIMVSSMKHRIGGKWGVLSVQKSPAIIAKNR